MEFGVPKEIRDLETRVALTPSGVLSLADAVTRSTWNAMPGPDPGSAIRNIGRPVRRSSFLPLRRTGEPMSWSR